MHLLSYFSLTAFSDYFLSSCLLCSFNASVHLDRNLVLGDLSVEWDGIPVQNSKDHAWSSTHLSTQNGAFLALLPTQAPCSLPKKLCLQIGNPPGGGGLTWHERLHLENKNVKQMCFPFVHGALCTPVSVY